MSARCKAAHNCNVYHLYNHICCILRRMAEQGLDVHLHSFIGDNLVTLKP